MLTSSSQTAPTFPTSRHGAQPSPLTVLILLPTEALIQAIRKFFLRFILGMARLQQ